MDRQTLTLIKCAILMAASFAGCGPLPGSPPPGYTSVRFSSTERYSGLLDSLSSLSTTLSGGIYLFVQRDSSPSFATNMRITQSSASLASGSLTLPNGNYRFYAFGFPGTNLNGSLYCGQAGGNNAIALNGGTQTVSLTLDSSTCGVAPFATGSYVSGGVPKQIQIEDCGQTEFDSFRLLTGCSGGTVSIQSVRISFPLYTAQDSNLSDLPSQPAPDVNNSRCVTISGSTSTMTLPFSVPTVFGATASPPRIHTRIAFYSGTSNCDVAPSWTYEFPEGLANLASAKRYNASKALSGTGATIVKTNMLSAPPHLYLLNN